MDNPKVGMSGPVISKGLGPFVRPFGDFNEYKIPSITWDKDPIAVKWLMWNCVLFRTKMLNEIGFVKKFEPFNWIIGAGAYLKDTERNTKDLFKMSRL